MLHKNKIIYTWYNYIILKQKQRALKLDCREEISSFFNTTFDIITNIGFSEHVGEGDIEVNLFKSQYSLFKSLHNLGKIGTIYFHDVPMIHNWYQHGVVHYNKSFFEKLSEINHYEKMFLFLSDYGRDNLTVYLFIYLFVLFYLNIIKFNEF